MSECCLIVASVLFVRHVVAAVHDHQGKCVMESISGTVHVVFEECTQAAWLY
ncbi:MAG: hypothetical protein ACM3SR_10720 [Ignavibacteriales bacterium]